MQPIPSLGQIVHYHAGNGRTYAAIVTRVWGPFCVNLLVLDDGRGELNGHGSPMLALQSVSWATTYGFVGAWSFPEAEHSYPDADIAAPLILGQTAAPAPIVASTTIAADETPEITIASTEPAGK